MSITRVVRRNLERAGESRRAIKKAHNMWQPNVKVLGVRIPIRIPAWIDMRPRDKRGNLGGFCAEIAKRVEYLKAYGAVRPERRARKEVGGK